MQTITAAQAVSTPVTQCAYAETFTNPIYVNPGEFVAIAVRHIGTAASAGVIGTICALDYAWE